MTTLQHYSWEEKRAPRRFSAPPMLSLHIALRDFIKWFTVLQRYVHVTMLFPIASTKKLELLSSFLSHHWCLLTTRQEDGTLISSWSYAFYWTEDTHENRASTVPLLQSDFIAVGSETAILRFAYCGKRTNLLSSEKRVRFPYPFPRAPSFFQSRCSPSR